MPVGHTVADLPSVVSDELRLAFDGRVGGVVGHVNEEWPVGAVLDGANGFTGEPVGAVMQSAAGGSPSRDSSGQRQISLKDLKEILDQWAEKAAEGLNEAIGK